MARNNPNRAITQGDRYRAGHNPIRPISQKQKELLLSLKVDPELFPTMEEASVAIQLLLKDRT